MDYVFEILKMAKFVIANKANTVAAQMGGYNRLRMMLGGEIIKMDNGIAIKWPNKKRSKGNFVEIVLLPNDTYKMTFYNVAGYNKKKVKEYKGLYADALKDTFERQTGWYLR